jgi:hypothetical protein
MKKKILGSVVAVMLVTLACGGSTTPAIPAGSNVETIVAETIQAHESSAPAAASETPLPTSTPVNGTMVSVNNISFVIPTGIGSGAQAEFVQAVPPAADMPWWEVGPAYNRYLIQGYPLPKTFHLPQIFVYPVAEYIQMNDGVATVVDNLKAVINAPGQPWPERLPFLPAFNAAQTFHSNEQLLAFQSGAGLRYLTQYGQAPSPVNNTEMFYTYQGLTNDGAYYVAAILPVSAPFLAADRFPESPLPPDGVPFDWNNFENTDQHFDLVKQKLNAADPNSFTPTLLKLDELIQSILVNSQ